MERPNTGSVVGGRLLLSVSMVGQLAPVPLYANVGSANGVALTDTDAPALAASFCGTATLDGAEVAQDCTAV
jgi:hypothetical protein